MRNSILAGLVILLMLPSTRVYADDYADDFPGYDGVVLFFGADYCAPCRASKASVRKLEKQGRPIRYVDIQTPQGAQLAAEYGVRSLPHVVRLKKRKAVAMLRPQSFATDPEYGLTWFTEKVPRNYATAPILPTFSTSELCTCGCTLGPNGECYCNETQSVPETIAPERPIDGGPEFGEDIEVDVFRDEAPASSTARVVSTSCALCHATDTTIMQPSHWGNSVFLRLANTDVDNSCPPGKPLDAAVLEELFPSTP